jgi:hypothetical protein
LISPQTQITFDNRSSHRWARGKGRWIIHAHAPTTRKLRNLEETDLWQTGGDLISSKSGIILHPLGDRTVRDFTALPVTADRGRDLPLGKKTAADEVGNAPIR